ncbi:MAG: guanine-specific ribonuclease N1 and T1 [Comamonadaceae bacterium]|nr:MAG: guanine-specific ribonuclease N1 and T1 [Comamonadaceae bacterium]
MAAYAFPTSMVSKLVLAGCMLGTLAMGSVEVSAREWSDRPTRAESTSAGSVALTELPPEGRSTYRAILSGGPFRYDKDGAVFGNRERLLPSERRGHYREYTVETPGSRDRGARRIVCGEPHRPAPVCWYTADHYASFRRIVP